MTSNILSASWYRVAALKPRLRNHVVIHRHDYRGRVWHVLEDPVSGRVHRFSPEAYRFIGLLDGKRSIDEIWEALQTELGDLAPTQNDVIRVLSQLHTADALISEAAPDSLEMFRRYQRHEWQRWRQRIASPLAVRVPVIDPERFLEATWPAVRWLFTWFGAVLWTVVVVAGVVLAAINWGAITDNIVDRSLAPANLLVLWLVYPFVKAFHELGHGYAIKKSGGEVHDIGIMFLVLVPVPYVDATAVSGFRDSRQRMLVGAMGILVEMFLAAVALMIWLVAEPGSVHAVAYNVMLIGGVSTVLFNGNPLLRFDGYYVLQDALEIPNLGTRSNRYLGYLIQRYLFGVSDAESPADAPGERFWLAGYGVASFCYRVFILTAIILYISTRFFGIGIILAIWAAVTMIGVPVAKALNFLFNDQRLRENRMRSLSVSGGLLALVLLFLFLVPVPDWTRVNGVIWPPDESQVRAGTEGFVSDIKVSSGAEVTAGELLIVADDPLIHTRLKLQQADREALENQLKAARAEDLVQAGVINEALKAAVAAEELTESKLKKLAIVSPRSGKFVLPGEEDLRDTFVSQGQLLGYVLDESEPLHIRASLNQDEVGLVRERLTRVHVTTADWDSDSYLAESVRLIPGGSHRLPSPALGTGAGGDIPIDPADPGAQTTLERVFELEITMQSDMRSELLGQRVNVRLDHGLKPIGLQAMRAIRQLFLGLIDV